MKVEEFYTLGTLCPTSHPVAFDKGAKCCMDHFDCDGDLLKKEDTCCKGGKSVACPPDRLCSSNPHYGKKKLTLKNSRI